jgi:hypothetical protein
MADLAVKAAGRDTPGNFAPEHHLGISGGRDIIPGTGNAIR